MPDFDTRTPQEERNKPLRLRIALIASKLRTQLAAIKPRIPLIGNRVRSLLTASKVRVLSLAERLRSLLVATRLRTLLISGGILLFVVAAIPIGLLIYSSSRMGDQQQVGGIFSGMHSGPIENIEVDADLNRKMIFQLSGPYQTPSPYAISSMNVNGSGLKQLTNTVDQRRMSYSSEDPARSPDLKRIAFTRLVTEYPASVDASESASASPRAAGPSYIQVPYVFVMNADGSDQHQFLDRAAAKPDWSPDGKYVAFSSDENWTLSGVSEKGVAEDGDCDLYIASVDDPDTVSRLTNEPGCESNPSWSPDGTKIAFTSDRGGNLDIYVINACCQQGDTNQPQQLTDDSLDDTDPAWSPDGTKIAFTRSVPDIETNIVTNDPVKPPEADVYKMDVDGSRQTRLTYSKATEAQPTWSPDGTKIAFTRQAFPGASPESDSMNATTGIFTMDSDGTDPAVVKIFQSEIASYPEWGVTAPQGTGAEQAVEDEPTEEATADWRALDARLPDVAVQVYIDSLTTTQESSAEYMTLSVMKGLNPSGKEKVVQYLAESGLLTSIPLNGVDLRGTDFSNANLSGAQWSSVNLSGVNLSNANLSGASLYAANLTDTDLSGANLSGAIVEVADFRGANLSGADLSGAYLLSAKVTDAQLAQAESLAGAQMPDGTQHP
jgi:Tol biopolymer transport system component